MSGEVDESVVELLIKGVAGELPGDQYSELIATSSIAEKRAAGRALARTALALAAERTVLDMSMQELAALAAVWAVVSKWNVALVPERRLGDVMKVLPADHVAQIERALLWGGFAHADDDVVDQDEVL
jgi:hypothetical protein